ncbi:hypothetical protein GH733_013994 [Mirounga leonina]|nr:hypothetical protein GH733_013994 [Mirounga leonina]
MDLLHPSPEEKRKHKEQHLVWSPNTYFVDVKRPTKPLRRLSPEKLDDSERRPYGAAQCHVDIDLMKPLRGRK